MTQQFSIEQQMQFDTSNCNDVTDDIQLYNESSVFEARKNKCATCDKNNRETMVCELCGCPIVMMWQFNFKTCPEGKW